MTRAPEEEITEPYMTGFQYYSFGHKTSNRGHRCNIKPREAFWLTVTKLGMAVATGSNNRTSSEWFKQAHSLKRLLDSSFSP